MAETHAGKGSLPYDHPLSLGGAGVSGTLAANIIAPAADLVIGIGTRFTDFPTASKTAFQDPGVRFININVAEFDAFKHAAVPLVGRRPGDAGGAGRRRRRLRHRTRLPRPRPGAQPRVGRGGRTRLRAQRRRHPHAGRGHRRGRSLGRCPRRGRDLGRQPAGRPAQALALARRRQLPGRVRLLDDGLRDRGWPRCQAGGPRPRGLRDGRRRLVPDDELRDHDRGPGEPQADRRPRGQQGLQRA